jgi:hypothetical protein
LTLQPANLTGRHEPDLPTRIAKSNIDIVLVV